MPEETFEPVYVPEDDFKFNLGDRVRIIEPGPRNGLIGVIAGCFGPHQDIPRLHDTVIATTPWSDQMYTVQIDGTDPASDNPEIIEESRLIASN